MLNLSSFSRNPSQTNSDDYNFDSFSFWTFSWLPSLKKSGNSWMNWKMTCNPKLQITPRWLNRVRMRNSFTVFFPLFLHAQVGQWTKAFPTRLYSVPHDALMSRIALCSENLTANLVSNFRQKKIKGNCLQKFLHSFLRRHFAGKPVVESWNVGCLLRLEETYEKISICRTNFYFIALRREK